MKSFVDVVRSVLDEEFELTNSEKKEITDGIINGMKKEIMGMKPTDQFQIPGIMKIECVAIPEKTVRNPRTGETFQKPAHNGLKIKLLKIKDEYKNQK